MVRDALREGALEWRGQLRNDPSARKAGSFLDRDRVLSWSDPRFLLIAVNPTDLLDGQRTLPIQRM